MPGSPAGAWSPGIRGLGIGTLQALASRDGGPPAPGPPSSACRGPTARIEAVIDDPDVDAVYIPLPNELHRPWVFAAADAGKHVLCEKPLALDAAEAARMVEHCRARGVVLMEAFMWRHQPRTAGTPAAGR